MNAVPNLVCINPGPQHALWTAALIALTSCPSAARAELEVLSHNAAVWPGAAPVRTSIIEGGSRGVRGDRTHAQTFQVTEAFKVDRVLLAYEWIGGGTPATNFTKIRIVEIEDVFSGTYSPGAVVAPQISFAIEQEPTPETPNSYYALELGWNAEVDGPLTLSPRVGNQGYALEVTGTQIGQGTSTIAVIERQGGPYALGRSIEISSNPAWTNGLWDIPIIITAVPALPGDFDGDDDVDGVDLATWESNVGMVDATTADGDADGDGLVDGNDFLVWQRNVTEPNPEMAAVPEPTTAAMAVGAVLAAGIFFGRDRHARVHRRKA